MSIGLKSICKIQLKKVADQTRNHGFMAHLMYLREADSASKVHSLLGLILTHSCGLIPTGSCGLILTHSRSLIPTALRQPLLTSLQQPLLTTLICPHLTSNSMCLIWPHLMLNTIASFDVEEIN